MRNLEDTNDSIGLTCLFNFLCLCPTNLIMKLNITDLSKEAYSFNMKDLVIVCVYLFRVLSLDETRHVVQNRTAVINDSKTAAKESQIFRSTLFLT